MSHISFRLHLTETGFDVDRLTTTKAPYVGWEASRPQRILEIFQCHDIASHSFDDHYGIELDQYAKAKQIAQQYEVTVADDIPPTLFQQVYQTFYRPEVDMKQLEERLGATFWQKLRHFQRVGIRTIVQNQRFYLADEMGSGKTIQAAGYLQYFKDRWPALVVCPSSLRYSLKAEFCQWLELKDDDVVVISSAADFKKKKFAQRLQDHKLLIISYGLIDHEFLKRRCYHILICDEAHYLKSFKSKRFKQLRPLALAATHVLLLSGTPFSYPVDLWTQISLLYPRLYPTFFSFKPTSPQSEFVPRYCAPQKTFHQWWMRGYERKSELQTILWTMMLRRRKKDILPELPPKLRSCITLEPLNPKQQAEIRKVLDAEVQTKHSQYDYMESFRLTCEYKIPKVLKFLEEGLLSDLMHEDRQLKVLIFFHHSMMKLALEEFLQKKSVSYFVIDGSVEPATRFQHQQDFQQTDKYRIGLLSIMAAGAGLTLTAARIVVFAELLFGPELLQAEDRAHRVGQSDLVNILYLIQPNTTDIINWQLVKKKERESSFILDGHAHHLQSNTAETQAEEKLSHVLKRKAEQIGQPNKRVQYVSSRQNSNVV